MAGDYIRFTHKPRHRYSGVLMQQGRVQLDSDLNEQVETVKRRWELQAFDTFGQCAVPAATTPEGFEITNVTATDCVIGVGRMYVEGLLAENFAEDPPVSYLNQPFYPDPPDFSSGAGQSTLVYLDVWDREVTWLQNRGLLDPALLGPDTATRIQTVWQVKTHAGTCDDPLNDLFPPSAARLSSRAVQPPSSDDPCILPPTGGYRGLENRLYRVEIHDAGDPQGPEGLASVRIKWSRENASVSTAVEAIDTNSITVARIGRDSVLRFSVGDWIELLDDHRELTEVAGQMARILEIDEANRIVTLDQNVALDFDANDPDRHTRVTRWDQKAPQNVVDGNGLMAGSDDWIALEDGVEVLLTLDPLSGLVHVGDYWVFAARTADASVEELAAAAPRGIVHHYCHLAAFSDPAGPVDDCRHLCDPCAGAIPPTGGHEPAEMEMCCVVVPPGQSIQSAIDSLPAAGGCVCLKAGIHQIASAITIQQSNIILHGESVGARIVGPGSPVTLLQIGAADTVHIHDLTFDALNAQQTDAVVEVRGCHEATISDCRIIGRRNPEADTLLTGILASDCATIDVHGNELTSLAFGVRVEQTQDVQVSNNRVTAPPLDTLTGMLTVGVSLSATNMTATQTGEWRVEGNLIVNYKTGVFVAKTGASIDVPHVGCLVGDNVVFRNSEVQLTPALTPLNPLGVLVPKAVPPAGLIDNRIYAIDLDISHGVACRNTIDLNDTSHGGIRTTGAQSHIHGNVIVGPLGLAPTLSQVPPLGILVGPRSATSSLPDQSTVAGNVLHGSLDGIFVAGSGIERIHVRANDIAPSRETPTAKPRLAIALRGASAAVIEGNETEGARRAVSLSEGTMTRVLHNHLKDGGVGLLTYKDIDEAGLELSYNYIENMEGPGAVCSRLIGSAVFSHNRVERCGQTVLAGTQGAPTITPEASAGLFVDSQGHVRIESCEVLDTGVLPDGGGGNTAAIGMYIRTPSCQLANNRVAYSIHPAPLPPGPEHRSLLLVNLPSMVPLGHAIVADNSFSGPGLPHFVEVGRFTTAGFSKTQFNNNRCEHHVAQGVPAKGAATVSFKGRHLIVTSNHVESIPGMDSMNFHTPQALVLMGNVTTGGFELTGGGVKPPNTVDFNILVP